MVAFPNPARHPGQFRGTAQLAISQFNTELWNQICKLPDARGLRLLGVSDEDGSSIEIGREFWRYDPATGLHVDVLPIMRKHPSVGWLELVEEDGHVAVSLLLDGTEAEGNVTVDVFPGP
jgi:hypothetical protein